LLLYYITDRMQFPGGGSDRQRALLKKIAEAAHCGVDFIQLREKDLCTRDLETLVRAAVAAVRENSRETRLLINSRSDVGMACEADGVHLRSDDVSPRDVRSIWTHGVSPSATRSGSATAPWQAGSQPVIGASCHSVGEVSRAASEGADLAVFAPVFEKTGASQVHAAGLDALRAACRQTIPVLALGGVTLDNARACVTAGAAGVAGIRLFQANDIAEVVRSLRG
jgi:thiamine-phosphate pyrophosphorylase